MKKEEKSEKKTRQGGFPIVDLETAIAIIKEGSMAGWKMSRETFVKATGGSTIKSGHFILKLAALRDYGLLERGGDIKFTQLAKELIAPHSGDIDLQQLKEAFLSSNIFNSLYERLRNSSGETNFTVIANLGVHDFKIALKRKNLFARNFISSGKYAGLLKELADGKIQVVADGDNKNKKITEETMSTRDDRRVEYEYTLKDQGFGWQLSLSTIKPLNSDVRKKLIEITESIESLN